MSASKVGRPQLVRGDRAKGVAVILSLALAAAGCLVAVASPVRAADGCGSGYFAGNTESYFDQDVAERDGRRIINKVGGYARWCTYDSSYDQYRRRVVVGLPHDTYATADFSGTGISKICLTHSVTVYAEDIEEGRSIGLGIGWAEPPGVSVSKSFGALSRTITMTDCSSTVTPRVRIFPADFTFTVPKAGSFNDPRITKVRLATSASMRFVEGGTATTIQTSASDSNDGTTREGEEKPDPSADTTMPTLGKPEVTLSNPYSRTANYSLSASDDVGVTRMRVRATGDPDWRPWVAYAQQGTVVLPDRYGDFTVWFQVEDAAGNPSLARAADNVTRVQDTEGPLLGKPIVTRSDQNSAFVPFSLDASDPSGVTQMRVRLGPVESEWRSWQDFSPSGTVVLPGYGDYMIWFQVRDAYGNESLERATDLITRTAAVGLNLQQVDNNGNVRSCGSSESTACSNVVRKFRATISGDVLPKTDLLVKLWRYVNGTWVETDPSPYARYPISSSTVNFEFPSGAVAGLWRVQVQVPRDDANHTDFAASGYQYIQET